MRTLVRTVEHERSKNAIKTRVDSSTKSLAECIHWSIRTSCQNEKQDIGWIKMMARSGLSVFLHVLYGPNTYEDSTQNFAHKFETGFEDFNSPF